MFDGKIIEKIDREDKKILPILFPPPIVYALYGAIRLSIILAHEGTADWFYSNFIQIYFNEIIRPAKVQDHFVQFLNYKDNSHLIFLNMTIITEEIMQIDENNIIEYIIYWINNGYYVSSQVDVSLLPNTSYYNLNPKIHGVNIFGYDLSNNVLKILDFNENRSLSVIDIKFIDFKKAFLSEHGIEKIAQDNLAKKFHIKLYKFVEKFGYHNDNKYPLDINFIIEQFKDYYFSKNTSFRSNPIYKKEYNVHFGISTHIALVEYLKGVNNNDKIMDARAFYAIWEHKKIMRQRVKYFYEKNILKEASLLDKISVVEKKANFLKMKSIKYIMVKDKTLINEMILLLEEIISMEKIFLDDIIIDLESNNA